ncbi:hypothetical protein PsorP6_016407 [Peronosclerospora sorghi]|uniref:Uncharacterized protein n=1 Tax=Peronosclerospora sorghi TaxID=230839 RepID=A0ACC0VRQ5_9STRA|nr:hypothetical protein PsorP6_016407 [Peronosclerospora sorghi]
MSAKSPDVVDDMIDDSLLGILIILFVVMLSTGYVYIQQLWQGDTQQRGNVTRTMARMAPSMAALSAPQHVVSTSGLTTRQCRLHCTLPLRYGARAITLSVEVLLQPDETERLSWTSDDVPSLLADLSYIADVYILCTINDANKAMTRMQCIRKFISTHPDLKSNETAGGGIKAHKILFCTTSIGKIAFVRQIEPLVHVDVDAAIVRDLEKHVPRIVHISTRSEDTVVPTIPNVIHVGNSFVEYFSIISCEQL